MSPAEPAAFSVDTGLFRQLGELLVGRDSTAVIELIKNAYDADATYILLRGENLESVESSTIQIVDNGTGMTRDQFRNGFLRIAARTKASGDRRSPVFGRRFTGEKGVGRLAAHKLAGRLEIDSIAAIDAAGQPAVGAQIGRPPDEILLALAGSERTLVEATIDWDAIESAPTLSEISSGLLLDSRVLTKLAPTGTTLRLVRLRHAWSTSDIHDLARQLGNFEPPQSLSRPLPRTVLPEPLLFTAPLVRDAQAADPGLKLELEGDFTSPEEYWGQIERTADWILEIRAVRGADVQYALSPTQAGLALNDFGRRLVASAPHPAAAEGPFFDARIMLRSGPTPTLERAWASMNSGVRIYLEGFRVLPYGEVRNDWLGLDIDYTRRSGRFELNPLLSGAADDLSQLRSLAARDLSLRLQPNRNFFGAVFLTEAGSGGLRTLVNREGFVPDDAYDRLVATVRTGVDLLHRAWALASYSQKRDAEDRARQERDAEDRAKRERESTNSGADGQRPPEEVTEAADPSIGPEPLAGGDEDAGDFSEGESDVLGGAQQRAGSAARLLTRLHELRNALEGLESTGSESVISADRADVGRRLRQVEAAADALIEDASLLRVLASVGTQLSAFSHEIAHLIPAAAAAERALDPQPGHRWPPRAVAARRAVADMRRALERQAAYLVDIASKEGRRRRVRLDVHERVDAAFLGFLGLAAEREIDLLNSVPRGLRTPPMFRAELQAVLANLLSNAIKATDREGQIAISGVAMDGAIQILVQNTGVEVDLEESERWFQPYESTSTSLDPALGQGMGLGLPITRDLLSEYGGTVRFVRPNGEYATAVQVFIPE